MNDIFLIDVWHVILHHCDLLSQLRLIAICSHFYHSLFITDMYNLSNVQTFMLTNAVLKQKKFNRLIQLSLHDNKNIDDVSFLIRLKYLCVCDAYKID